MRTCLLLLPGLLAASLGAQAQTQTGIATGIETTTLPATPYQVQYDSLQARARRIRMQTAAGTLDVMARYRALGGTRRVITSMGTPRTVPVQNDLSVLRDVKLKREVVKHKTHGAIVRKVAYLAGGRRRLYEYFEDGQLVQLELYDYPLATGSGSNIFVTIRWLRGDYLTVSQRASTGTGGYTTQTQAFAEPRPIAQ